jgi:hypothetical protein
MLYLCSYRPLISTEQGRIAASTFLLPPFVDGSCRREPDFESRFPSISALCRFRLFAPRLHENDTVIYITRQGKYQYAYNHWRLVAILDVVKRFESHKDAAEWYRAQGCSLPSNCHVHGNPPLPLEKTSAEIESVSRWDAGYQLRARKCGVFLACKSEFLELRDPPTLTRETMLSVFGRVPNTQNPPRISDEEFSGLLRLARL